MVAEAVETQQSFELLKSLGCDTAQGFLISKPLAVEAFDVFKQKHALQQELQG